jgi:hypothetical protein
MLDVSSLQKGAKFACSNCGTILVVGEAVVAKRSFEESGPAFQRKAQTEKPEMPTRARHRRAPTADAPASKSSRLPLYLGLGGGAVAAIVIIVVVARNADEGPGFGGPGRGGGGGGARAKGPSRDDWWADRGARLDAANAKRLRVFLKEAKERGFDQDPVFWEPTADEIYAALLREDPDDPEANRRSGRKSLRDYPDFKRVWQAMNENFRVLSREQKDFCDLHASTIDEGKQVWLEAKAWTDAKGMLDDFVKWRKEQDANPASAKILKGVDEATAILGKDEAGKARGFVAAVEGPFILLLAHPVGGEDEETVKQERAKRGARYAKALKVLWDEFEKRFREPLGLPAMEKGRYYYQVVLSKRADFARFIRTGTGYDVNGDIAGFFAPRTKWAGVRVATEEKQATYAASDLAHEAVHQLHAHYARDPKMKALSFFDEWTGIWFTEGWAEYLGGGLKFDPGSGDTRFTGIPKRRVEFLQGMRDNGVPYIPLRDFVQLPSVESFMRYAVGTWVPLFRDDEDMPEQAHTWFQQQEGPYWKVLYAQSWFLAYFLNEFGDGQYRAKYLDLVMTALRGKQKPEKYRKDRTVAERWGSAYDAFVEIMELKDEKAWKALQREHDRFLRKVLRDAKN